MDKIKYKEKVDHARLIQPIIGKWGKVPLRCACTQEEVLEKLRRLRLLQGLHGLWGNSSQEGRYNEDESIGSSNLLEEFLKLCPCRKSHGNVFNNCLGTKKTVLMGFGISNKKEWKTIEE